MAADMGVELLDEEEYRRLQELGPFDTKTSSWVKAPEEIPAAAAPSLGISATAARSSTITAPALSTAPGVSGGMVRV